MARETSKPGKKAYELLDISQESTTKNSELTVLLEEYKSLRDEIISLQEFSRQNITTTYAGIGVISATAPLIIEKDLQFAFLIFPVLFYSLALTSTKYAFAGLNIGNHLKKVIIPNIRKCLADERKGKTYDQIMSWEEGKGVVRKYGLLLLPATGAHYWITLFSAILCLIAFFAFPLKNPEKSLPDYLLFASLGINSVIFIYTAIVGLVAGFSR